MSKEVHFFENGRSLGYWTARITPIGSWTLRYRRCGVPCLLTALSYVYLTYMLRISYVIDKEKQRPNIPFEREGDSYRIPAGYETAFHLLNLN